jgi:hypothetical protein
LHELDCFYLELSGKGSLSLLHDLFPSSIGSTLPSLSSPHFRVKTSCMLMRLHGSQKSVEVAPKLPPAPCKRMKRTRSRYEGDFLPLFVLICGEMDTHGPE